jgi:hypothetical protein
MPGIDDISLQIGELRADVRNLAQRVEAVDEKVDVLDEKVDDLNKVRWKGKGVLIAICTGAGVAGQKILAILPSLGK